MEYIVERKGGVMIKVEKDNFYKVLKPELFKAGTKLLGKYDLWLNSAMKEPHICFSKSFGTEEDHKFCSHNFMWCGFNPKTNILELSCSSYGGICGFVFDETHLSVKEIKGIDRECIMFTINFIKELRDKGIIEVEK